MADAAAEPVVIARVEGGIGHITLNRPKALNALNLDMVRLCDAALTEFEADPKIAAVLIDGAGGRAFCAGGDIRLIRDTGRDNPEFAATFWAEEYRLNNRIAHYPKPYIALMDGIVMGGGIGMSGHGSVRIVTERSMLAMPEVGIGFMPDVGGTFLLGRAGPVGKMLAVTGDRFGAADAIRIGMADHMIPSAELPAFVEALVGHGYGADAAADVAAIVARFAATPEPGILGPLEQLAAAAFGKATPLEALAVLEADGAEGQRIAGLMRAKSPTSVVVTFAEMEHARSMSREACFDMEYRVSLRSLMKPDFYEGVRAVVVDKDQNPKWDPPTLEQVDPAIVDWFFASLGDQELGLAPGA
ncbi:enoyl-CoA hydratase/isomerase family protein [Segnochrobactraceae bacterium EtOH-i3]